MVAGIRDGDYEGDLCGGRIVYILIETKVTGPTSVIKWHGIHQCEFAVFICTAYARYNHWDNWVKGTWDLSEPLNIFATSCVSIIISKLKA